METRTLEELAPDTLELVDELIRRLGLENGRVELELSAGRAIKVWTHRAYTRSELVRFDPS